MPKRLKFNDPDFEQKLFKRRALVLSFIILILAGVLVARLFFLQVIEHELYTTLSNQNQLNLIPIEPARGLIYDRNGTLLAENLPVFSLDVIPEKVHNLKETIARLNRLIPLDQADLKDFYKTLPQKRPFEPVPLKLNLSEIEVARFAINQWRFPGIVINARMLRYYPLGPTVAQAVGYMGRINQEELQQVDPDNYSATNYIGKIGIEKNYETLLHGQVGYQQVETDASGRVVRILKRMPPVAGSTIYLTIDSQLQQVAEQAFGSYAGAIVAIDPQNGQVLALVSNPSYNPNLFVEGISNASFQALQSAPNRPLYNRALRGLFAPGSTVKPFIAVGSLANGTVTPTYTIQDPGYFVFGTHTYRDWRKGGHGSVNVQKAITVSCDTFFFNLALKLGINRLDNIYTSFGLGQKTGIDIEEELGGLVPTPAWKLKARKLPWYTGDTIVAGIGQGYLLVTPLQMANAVSAMAMHGLHFVPHLLLKTVYANGKTVYDIPKKFPTINYPDSAWNLAIAGMQNVMKPGGTGLGHFGGNIPYTMGAKTGTAQVFSTGLRPSMSDKDQNDLPVNLRDNSWFIAFAPVDHPIIAVAVIEEHSKDAAAVARQVMDYYLLTEKHLPASELIPGVPLTGPGNTLPANQNNPTTPNNGTAAPSNTNNAPTNTTTPNTITPKKTNTTNTNPVTTNPAPPVANRSD